MDCKRATFPLNKQIYKKMGYIEEYLRFIPEFYDKNKLSLHQEHSPLFCTLQQINDKNRPVMEFEVSGTIGARPNDVYHAWLESEKHTGMTGGKAEVSDTVGAPFQAWDGYIEGINLELDPGKRILQHWRTSEFEESDEDSLLEILFDPEGDKTRVTIKHSNLPAHGMQYKQGWVDNYFDPMNTYFSQ
jgi:uncharacterized protein YndB with AHSA1/START domain